jgi:hypothetical protein
VTVTENFEWGADGDAITTSGGTVTWRATLAGTCLAQIDTAQAHGGTRSLGIYRDGTNWPTAHFSLTAVSNHYEITFEARHTTGTYWMLLHGNGAKRIRIGCNPTTTIYYYYNAAGRYTALSTPHADDTWATITLTNIDFTAGTFDFYADGTKLATCEMETSAFTPDRVAYGCGSGTGVAGWCWVDDIVLEYLPGFPVEFPYEFPVEDGIYCYIDWDNDGDWSAGHENVSQYLRSYSIKRGKDSNMGRAQVGTAQITLKDVAGTYIPSSTVSSLAGLIVPGRKVKIQRNYGGVEYVLFTGYLDDIQNDYGDTVREAYFSCTDGSERLTGAELPTSYGAYVGCNSDTIVTDLFKYMGFSTGTYSVDTTTYSYSEVWPHRLTVKTAIQQLEDAEGSMFYIARAGTARWEAYDHRTTSHSTAAWTCPGTVWRTLKTQNNWKNITNKVTLKFTTLWLGSSTQNWRTSENLANGNPTYIPSSCTWDTWCTFRDAVGNQNRAWATIWTGTANTSSAGGGTTYTIRTTATSSSDHLWYNEAYGYGDCSYVTLYNPTTMNLYVMDFYSYGGQWQTGETVEVASESTSSRDNYGLKDKVYDLKWASTDNWQTIADDYVANNSSSRPTYIVELVPNSSDALTHALDLDISDRFTLEDSRISLSRDVYIDQVQHQWNVMDGVHHTYWTVSCAT